jgi:opacity protein-like surface antigen
VAYGNGLAQVLSPELMGKEADIYVEEKTGWNNFAGNLGKGSISVGIGFLDAYSPIKNSDSFEDNQSMPKIFAGYTFEIKKKLKGGIHIGIGGNELSKSAVSEYDQLKISTEIDESFLCVGLFARYNFTEGIFRPYVKGGLDFIGVFMTTTSVAESLDGSTQSLKTEVDQSGIKLNPILRAGLDFTLGNRFGLYGDVGTGLSLVQVGVLFNLE